MRHRVRFGRKSKMQKQPILKTWIGWNPVKPPLYAGLFSFFKSFMGISVNHYINMIEVTIFFGDTLSRFEHFKWCGPFTRANTDLC